jgi:hypothetical protein
MLSMMKVQKNILVAENKGLPALAVENKGLPEIPLVFLFAILLHQHTPL